MLSYSTCGWATLQALILGANVAVENWGTALVVAVALMVTFTLGKSADRMRAEMEAEDRAREALMAERIYRYATEE